MISVSKVSTFKPSSLQPWQIMIAIVLGFWLSGSLLIDAILMPVMSTSGMMSEPGFATAGYSLFWVFNRLELLCAAAILTGALALRYGQAQVARSTQQTVTLASILVVIALIVTYGLTPQMSGLGLQLDLFHSPSAPALMNGLHLRYWALEAVKLSIGGVLLNRAVRSAVANR
jgi:uncharacterized membrane protein